MARILPGDLWALKGLFELKVQIESSRLSSLVLWGWKKEVFSWANAFFASAPFLIDRKESFSVQRPDKVCRGLGEQNWTSLPGWTIMVPVQSGVRPISKFY